MKVAKSKTSKPVSSVQAFWSGKPVSVGEYDSELVSGRRVVLIAKLKGNRKTGRMIQIAFLDVDVEQDHINGDVPNGQGCSRSQCDAFDGCYVKGFPLHIFHIAKALRAYKSGTLPKLTASQFLMLIRQSTSPVRLGEFGDPTSVKFEVVEKITKASKKNGHTGYSHQWRTCDQQFKDVCMASVQSESDYQLAKSMGWKVFAIGLDPVKGERITCLNETKDISCESCRLCKGSNAKSSVVITPHGGQKNKLVILV
jgi:hypothetical protein